MMSFTDSSCAASTWFSDVNANGHGITGLCSINCIPLKDFLTTPLKVDVDAYGHAITDVGKLYIGDRWDDGSGARLQVRGSINVTGGNYLLNGQPLEGFVEKDILAGNNIVVTPGGPPDNPTITISATPAGASGQIQYNNSGNFGAGAGLTWDGTTFKVLGDVNITGQYLINGLPPPQVIKILVSSADILALATTPKTLLPAPGANKYYVPLLIIWEAHQTATPYTGAIAPDIEFSDGYTLLQRAGIPIDFFTTAGPAVKLLYGAIYDSLKLEINTGIYLRSPTSDLAAGTGYAYVYIYYWTQDIGA